MSPNGRRTSSAVTTSSSQKLCDPIPMKRTAAARTRSAPSAAVSRRELPTGKLGIALVEERLGALGEVVGGGAHGLRRHLLLERLRQRRLGRRVDHALGQADGDRRAGQQLVAQG